LRKIVLNSADALPDEVKEYLGETAARHAHWDAKKQVLKEHSRLVDHLPKEYVDYVLGYLVPRPEESPDPNHTSYSRYLDRGYEHLGLEHDLDFFPPSYVHGPFLPVLRKHEDEGLRLAHVLANTAVAKWREREEDPAHLSYSRRPLPVHIDLPNGRREFWGDEQVYYWYRPMSNGPHAVISALMALEVWMEERIEAGVDPERLFEKVLSGSDCVAVLGLCLGIALAYPDRCLRAALPLICSPAVWTMEAPRFAADEQGSFKFDPLGTHRTIYRLQGERDARPQRSLEVRHLAPRYALSDEEALRIPFEQAVGRFTENLPFRYQEERDSSEAVAELRERMEGFQVYGDRDNYRVRQTDEGIQIWVEPPEHIRKRNAEALASINESMRQFGLQMWAQKTIERGESADGMTIEEAVAAARGLQQPQDFATPYPPYLEAEDTRLQAIAGVAAAVLVTDFEWAQEHDLVAWCKDILLAAAAGPSRLSAFDSVNTRYPADTKVSAALGLGTLVARGAADSEVRERLIELTGDPHYQVAEAVFRGLKGAWNIDRDLCWAGCSLALSLCLLPKRFRFQHGTGKLRSPQEAEWAESLVRAHLDELGKDDRPPLPKIPVEDSDPVFLWDLASRVLGQVALSELVEEPSAKTQLLRLTDDLMAWTINKSMPKDPHGYRSDAPSAFCASAFCSLARSLIAARSSAVNPSDFFTLIVPSRAGSSASYSPGPRSMP
jgi:hypothetical protein